MSWHYSRKLVELHYEHLQNLQKNVYTESLGTNVMRCNLSSEKQRSTESRTKNWSSNESSISKEHQQGRIHNDVCGKSSICGGEKNDFRTRDYDGNCNRAKDQSDGMRSPPKRNQDGQSFREFGDTNTCRTFPTSQQATCLKSEASLGAVCVSLPYSRALVAAYSAENCSDGIPSALLNGNPTPQAFLSPDRMTAFSRLSRFGMTCKPLTEDLGADLLTWFQGDFLAKTYPQQDEAQELTESAAECGHTWHESLAKFDPASSSWKTRQFSLLGGLDEFSETWPRWGIMRAGECWELPTPSHIADIRARTTLEIESGSLERFPTPRSCSAMAANITPESAWNGARFPNLETVVGRKRWAIPKCQDSRHASWDRGKSNLGEQVAGIHGGHLNPTWVEWLMGWPLEWTDLKPSETDKFQAWCVSHGKR